METVTAMTFPGLSASESAALVSTAAAVQADPQHLWEVVNFESRHNPKAANPLSSAKGLIQFMDATAKSLGYKDSQELVTKNPSYEAQMLGPVREYFKKVGPPFPTRQSLYMAVFYPKFRSVPLTTALPDSVRKVNPGVDTVGDYVTKAMKAAQSKMPIGTLKKVAGFGAGGVLLVSAAVWFFFIRKSPGGRPT